MNLPQVNAALAKLDESSDATRMFIQVAKTGSKKEEVTLYANREGLIYLARCCLDLAERDATGAHYHFDETSTYSAELPLVISCKKEPNQ